MDLRLISNGGLGKYRVTCQRGISCLKRSASTRFSNSRCRKLSQAKITGITLSWREYRKLSACGTTECSFPDSVGPLKGDPTGDSRSKGGNRGATPKFVEVGCDWSEYCRSAYAFTLAWDVQALNIGEGSSRLILVIPAERA